MLLGVENVPAWAATRLENRICDFSPTASQCDVVCPADPESHPDNAVCRQAGTIRYAYDRNRKADRFSGRGGILESVDNKTVLGNPIPAHAEASAPEVRWVLQRRYAYDATGVAMYLYCQGNPVNGFDPSGHDDIGEMITSMAINTSLQGLGMPVVSSAVSTVGGQAVAAFIPQQVIQEISSAVEPDAVLFSASVSGNLPVGKYPVGIQAGGGVECLVSPKTHNAALYGYAGGGLTFGANSKSASGQFGFGFVFNTRDSQNYTKHFATLSLPYSKVPASIRNKVSKFLAGGFGTQLSGTSQDVIDAARSVGCDFATAVNLGTVNIFFDPTGGGSAGISFSTQRVGNSAPDNIGATYSYYWQLLPGDNKNVPFR